MKKRILSIVLAGVAVLTISGSALAQTATTGPSMVSVRAMDAIAASQGVGLSSFITNMENFFSQEFGWTPSQPVSIMLFSSGSDLTSSFAGITGHEMSQDERSFVLSSPAVFVETAPTGTSPTGWAILVNTDVENARQLARSITFEPQTISRSLIPTDISDDQAMGFIQGSLAQQFATVMGRDIIGTGGPMWLKEGLANTISFRLVPGNPQAAVWPLAVGAAQNEGNLVPLSSLQENANWMQSLSSTLTTRNAALGQAYLATNTLFDRFGGAAVLDLLRGTRGETFESVLQSSRGLSLQDLSNEYQSLIPQP